MGNTPTVILERSFVAEGKVIFEEGEPGAEAYLIQSGAVAIYTEHDGKAIQLARLGVGEIFGEMALIFDEHRTASVRAIEDCNLIPITRQSFQDKLAKTDSSIRAIMTMLTQRIVSSNNIVVNKKSNIEDLYETNQIIYQNIASGLSKTRQAEFQNTVLPKLDALLNAIKDFEGNADS